MFKPRKYAPALAAAIALSTAPVGFADENDVLLKVLVRKGILSESEAAAVKSEVAKEKAKEAKTVSAKPAAAPADTGGGLLSKIELSKPVEKLKLYGDIRLRYQYEDKDPQLFIPDGTKSNDVDRDPSGSQLSRWRFRLRLGADVQLTDHISAGVELSTNQASDSANQTFENGFDDYNIYISKRSLRWDPTPAYTFVGGKMNNPFYHAPGLVWDPDITPNEPPKLSVSTSWVVVRKQSRVIRRRARHQGPGPCRTSLGAKPDCRDSSFSTTTTRTTSTRRVERLPICLRLNFSAATSFDNGMKLTVGPSWLI
jgi:hypothetical protein